MRFGKRFWKTAGSRRLSVTLLSTILLSPLALAACDNAGGGGLAGGSGSADCEKYPSEDIRMLVPYSAGGGFDTWARLMAPYLAKHLGGDIEVTVENSPGGGGMRAVNQTFSAPPDGNTVIFTEPGYIAVNQVLGRATDNFDLRKLTYLGEVTADPQVFAVAPDSDIDSIEDMVDRPIKHAAQDISPIETITYSTYGVDADYILHEGTSEVALAVRRGDADATVVSLSSVLEFLKAGELKPVLYIGTEEITPDLLGHAQLKGAPTAADTGHPELAKVLEQHRVLAAPPELPGCVQKKLSDALSKTLADPKFEAQAEKAELRIVPQDADEAQRRAAETLKTFTKHRDTLRKEIGD